MTSSPSSSPSTQALRNAQFQEKLVLLNKEFLRQITVWLEKCPHYDLSPSVKTYLKHVRELDKAYSDPAERKKLVAKRTGNGSASTAKISADATLESSQQQKLLFNSKSDVTLSAGKSTADTKFPSISTPVAAEPPKFNLSNVSVIQPRLSFDPSSTAPSLMSTPVESKTPQLESTSGPTRSRKRAIRGGGPLGDDEIVVFRSSPLATDKGGPKIPSVGFQLPKPSPDFWTKKPAALESTDEGDTKAAKKAPAIHFPSFAPKTDGSPTISFPAFAPPPTAPKIADEGEKEEGGDEGEYVPPKSEIVENAEPGAIHSVKCSVMKYVDKNWVKMGVGMLHIKEDGGKKILVVRAATTTGTIWVNALIGKAMKVMKADGARIQLTFPTSSTEMSTFTFRFPNASEAGEVREKIENLAK